MSVTSLLRVWILGAVLGSFAAGALVGRAVFCASPPASADLLADQDFVADLTSRLSLSSDQRRKVMLVLQHAREREIQILRGAQFEQLPLTQRGEITALGDATRLRIRKLLDAEQLARYDRDSRPGGHVPSPSVTQQK